MSKQNNTEKIRQAVKDIIWMARRYAWGRQTYAPEMFNDAYDILREEFGDEIDNNYAKDHLGTRFYDIAIDSSSGHPYAIYGDDMQSQSNVELTNRKFYKKP